MPRKAAKPSFADLNAAKGGAAAVDRAIAILQAFTPEKSMLTLSEISQKTGLYKSTVLRLLASLEHGRLVVRRAEGYAVGPEVPRLFSVYSSSFSLEAVVVPALRMLVDKTLESAAFHVRQENSRLCLFRVDSPQIVRDHIKAGDLLPLDRGAGGRVILAFSGAQGDLYEKIRAEHVVVIAQDRTEDISGISSPVFSSGQKLEGAVTLTMPTHRLNPDHAQLVRACAEDITQRLGGYFLAGFYKKDGDRF